MNEKEWKKAINCTKEQLIEWLNEMYNDEKLYKDIIKEYEKSYGVIIRKKGKYTKVFTRGFIYKRNWSYEEK